MLVEQNLGPRSESRKQSPTALSVRGDASQAYAREESGHAGVCVGSAPQSAGTYAVIPFNKRVDLLQQSPKALLQRTLSGCRSRNNAARRLQAQGGPELWQVGYSDRKAEYAAQIHLAAQCSPGVFKAVGTEDHRLSDFKFKRPKAFFTLSGVQGRPP